MQSSLVLGGVAAAAGFGLALARRRRRIDLQAKSVLITGGSRGLGLVLAREFARHGCRVAVAARNGEELSRTREEFAWLGNGFMAIRCDVSNRREAEQLIRTVEKEWGAIDILVNCAGTISTGPIENQSLDDFEKAMANNFFGAVHTCLEAMPAMRRRGFGRIVNISSIGGKIAVPHLLPYTASKFALTGFSQGLRIELAKDGICVTTVYPGLMRTGSPRNVEVKGQHGPEYTWFTVADSLPGTSMSAIRAARTIVSACAAGRHEVVLGFPARMATFARAVTPGLLNQLMAAVNHWLLPSPTEAGSGSRWGFESETVITRSPLTALTRSAEVANNQV
jgi:NAD(P)-dependent dehydrogenase (short-subunit alcohol dehydrogenase family)